MLRVNKVIITVIIIFTLLFLPTCTSVLGINKKVIELGYDPYLMIYRKGTQSKALTDLQRWCNNKALFRSVDFMDYVPRVDGKSIREQFRGLFE